MTLYFFACIGCVLATSIETLIVARFLQALGACSGPVVARAIVRDVFGRERSAKVLAYVGTAMALAPVLGPIAGGFLQVWFGWQASFVVMAALGGLSVAGVLFLLRETNVNRSTVRPNHRVFCETTVDSHVIAAISATSYALHSRSAGSFPSYPPRHSCSLG